MISTMRKKLGPAIVTVIVGGIALVFVFFGVYSPDPTFTGAVAGSVNGEYITLSEFNRALNQRLEFYKSLNLSEAQLEAFRVREGVFRDLVNRRLMIQSVDSSGAGPSDAEVREEIKKIPAFQKEGKFDAGLYRQLLSANQYTPASFEKMVREDLMTERFREDLQRRILVSQEEVKREYLNSKEKRKLKYVFLVHDPVRHGVSVKEAEIETYLSDSNRLALAKNRFESTKETLYKGKNFEDVKRIIAKNLIQTEKTDVIRKKNEELANQVLPLLSVAGGDERVNALLKAAGVRVERSDWITRQASLIPKVGEIPELVEAAFAGKWTQARRFSTAQGVVVALVTESQTADFASATPKELDQTRERIRTQKESVLGRAVMQQLAENAKVKPNPQIVQ